MAQDPARLEEARQFASRFESADHPYYADTLGWIYFLEGNSSKAVEILNRVVKRAPNEAVFRYPLGGGPCRTG